MKFYERVYSLRIGDRSQGISIRSLRVMFTIEKSTDSTPNQATIQVYNLSDSTIGEIAGTLDDLYLVLEAGYRGSTQVIFQGDVTNFFTQRVGVDRVTTFDCGDGQRDLTATTFAKSYKKGTPLQSIIRDVLNSFPNVAKKNIQLPSIVDIGKTLFTGATYSGDSRQLLDDFARQFGFDWSVQDDSLVLTSRQVPSQGLPVLLSPSTGLIGSPAKTRRQGTDKTADDGITVMSLLNPEISPGTRLQIRSTFVSGRYIADRVTHMGDSREGQWYTEIQAREE